MAVRVARRSGQDSKETELSPLTRVGGYKEVQSGHVLCEETTTYIITFDNTHSLIRSKTINYMFVVDLMESDTGTDKENLSTSVTVSHFDPRSGPHGESSHPRVEDWSQIHLDRP